MTIKKNLLFDFLTNCHSLKDNTSFGIQLIKVGQMFKHVKLTLLYRRQLFTSLCVSYLTHLWGLVSWSMRPR